LTAFGHFVGDGARSSGSCEISKHDPARLRPQKPVRAQAGPDRLFIAPQLLFLDPPRYRIDQYPRSHRMNVLFPKGVNGNPVVPRVKFLFLGMILVDPEDRPPKIPLASRLTNGMDNEFGSYVFLSS